MPQHCVEQLQVRIELKSLGKASVAATDDVPPTGAQGRVSMLQVVEQVGTGKGLVASRHDGIPCSGIETLDAGAPDPVMYALRRQLVVLEVIAKPSAPGFVLVEQFAGHRDDFRGLARVGLA